MRITAIYGSQKKWPQNCHRLQFCPHFYLWIKTANGCSSMASQQNCKRWQFCGQFSEFMAYVSTKLQTLAVLWPLFGVYRMLSPPELQTLAVLWPLFGVYIKVAIKLQPLAVLWPQHSKLSFHHKTANPGSFMATFRSLQKVAIKLQTLAILWPHQVEFLFCSSVFTLVTNI